jgi:hypothetical protein
MIAPHYLRDIGLTRQQDQAPLPANSSPLDSPETVSPQETRERLTYFVVSSS